MNFTPHAWDAEGGRIMNRADAQYGQGLIEYMLILAVVAIALIGFMVGYKDRSATATNLMENNIQTSVDAVSQ